MKTLNLIIAVILAMAIFSTNSFAEGRGVQGFYIANAEDIIYQSGRAAMKDAGFDFNGYSLQNFWIGERLKRVDIDGDGNVYDGMSFIVVTIWLQPDTPMIKAQKMVLYLVVAEANGKFYQVATSTIADPQDHDYSSFYEAADNHFFMNEVIAEIK